MQMKSLIKSRQVPPFSQGYGSQSSISAKNVRKYINQAGYGKNNIVESVIRFFRTVIDITTF